METTNNVIEYLVFLDPKEFRVLYLDHYSCLSIYRSFDLFGQYLIRTMLYCGDKMWDINEIQKLLVQKAPPPPNIDPKVICSNTLHKMFKLQILIQKPNVVPLQMKLNDLFRNNLMSALSNFQVLPYDQSEEAVKKERSFRKLEQYAKEKWEDILYYMVDQIDSDSSYVPENERSTAKQLIHEAGLLLTKHEWNEEEEEDEDENDDEGGGGMKITSDGFKFLLMELRSQIWLLLQQYMKLQDSKRQNNKPFIFRVEVIKFLFMLSYLQVGKVYRTSQLNKSQRFLLHDLSEFGILRVHKKDRFYVTPLAIEFSKNSHRNNQLQQTSPPPSQQKQQASSQQPRQQNSIKTTSSNWKIPDLHGPIIVQTNFKVYAYTNSPIQIALLRLFCELEVRLPNLVVGSIERITVRAALVNGISADQIISYLWMHAHEKSKSLKGPPVPTNVSNQIRLWEKERNRMLAQDALFFYDLKDENTFNRLYSYAGTNNWILYVNKVEKWLVVRYEIEIERLMKQFIERLV